MTIEEKGYLVVIGLVATLIIPMIFNVPYVTAVYQSIWESVSTNMGFAMYLSVLLLAATGFIFDLPHQDFMRSTAGIILFLAALFVMPAFVSVPYVTNWYLAGWGWIAGIGATIVGWFKLKS